MDKLSFQAMNFGNEEDFHIAITELKWILKTTGKITNNDLEKVSSKYSFPIDFLKKGIEGLKSPDDYKISKSPWFPILFSWKVQQKQATDKLYRLHIDYLRSYSNTYSIILFSILISGFLTYFFYIYFSLDLWNLISLIFVFALFVIALYFQIIDPVANKKENLEEYERYLRQRGLEKIVEAGNKYAKQNAFLIGQAGNVLKKKLDEAIEMTVFSPHVENNTLVVDDFEDPNQEYQRRISELETNKK